MQSLAVRAQRDQSENNTRTLPTNQSTDQIHWHRGTGTSLDQSLHWEAPWVYSTLPLAMNAILHTQLDRVESALNTLIDSITSYNPSVPAAIDLLSADTELTKGLDQRNRPLPHPSSRLSTN